MIILLWLDIYSQVSIFLGYAFSLAALFSLGDSGRKVFIIITIRFRRSILTTLIAILINIRCSTLKVIDGMLVAPFENYHSQIFIHRNHGFLLIIYNAFNEKLPYLRRVVCILD